MNAQLLEYARIELRFALADLSGGTKGQLQAFAEHPPADKNFYPRQYLHMVELEDERQVRAERAPTYALETRSRRRPMPPINDMEFSMSSWRRAVNALPVSQNSWVKYCYGFDLKFEHQVYFCKYVWEEYERQLTVRLQDKVKKRLISLVWLAAQDVAAKNKNESYREYAGAALAGLMNVTRQCWGKTYAHHWASLKRKFELLDVEALSELLCSELVVISPEI